MSRDSMVSGGRHGAVLAALPPERERERERRRRGAAGEPACGVGEEIGPGKFQSAHEARPLGRGRVPAPAGG